MSNTIIVNEKKLELFKSALLLEWFSSVHVIADHDKTLTKAIVDGQSIPSLISVLRDDSKFLWQAYADTAHEFFQYYSAIENDPQIDYQTKHNAMHERWEKHFDLLIRSGLTRDMIVEALKFWKVELKEGTHQFFDILEKYKIPLIILSSSWLWTDAIETFLSQKWELRKNMTILSNKYIRDENGKALWIQEPIIHAFNKDETAIRENPIFETIKERKNVLLLWDSPEDVKMIHWFDYSHLLKIWFLKNDDAETIEHYSQYYDVLIVNDGSFEFVNGLLE